jgi:hypothetical protein
MPLSIAPQAGEPLSAWFSPERREGTAILQRFECTSRGDRVPGRCWRPDGSARALVLAVHELSHDARDPALSAAAAVWASRGWSTCAIDLPLHGERHNAKLSRRAVAARAAPAGAERSLWLGLLAQAVRDLARAVDALATRGPLPPVTCVAFGDSAPIALAFACLDARVRHAAALGSPRAVTADWGGAVTKALVWHARPDDLSVDPIS